LNGGRLSGVHDRRRKSTVAVDRLFSQRTVFVGRARVTNRSGHEKKRKRSHGPGKGGTAANPVKPRYEQTRSRSFSPAGNAFGRRGLVARVGRARSVLRVVWAHVDRFLVVGFFARTSDNEPISGRPYDSKRSRTRTDFLNVPLRVTRRT